MARQQGRLNWMMSKHIKECIFIYCEMFWCEKKQFVLKGIDKPGKMLNTL